MANKKAYTLLVAISIMILVFFALNLIVGSVRIPFEQVCAVLFKAVPQNPVWYNIINKTRLPQAITALLAGASLSVAGLQMQTLFGNPLAGPSELGISSGASLGVALMVLLSGRIGQILLSQAGLFGQVAIIVSALAGSLTVMLVILFIARKIKGNVTLLIVGVMIGYIVTAFIGVLKFFSTDEDVRSFVIWGLGSFSKITTTHILPYTIELLILLLLSLTTVKKLNLLMLGNGYARSLGLNLKQAKLRIILCSCLLTAIVTAYCGPIIFLGLAVPHLARILFRTADHRLLMPASALLGAMLALFCLLIARLPGMEGVLPINAVTSLIGAPVVLSVLLKKRQKEFCV